MTTGDAFRAFFAAPLPATAAGLLAEEARSVSPPWRPIPAERLHVTLRFLGATPRAKVPALAAALREAAAAEVPAAVTLGPARPFGGVLARPVSDPAGTLRRLAARLEERAAALGFPPEERPFRAHVTVARPVGGRGGARGAAGVAAGRPPRASQGAAAAAVGAATGAGAVPFTLDRIVLMESVPPPRGPAYAVVAEAPLGAAAAPGSTDETGITPPRGPGRQTRRQR